MLVTTAITGFRLRNDASDSSASTTMYCPEPSREFAPAAFSLPPITKVGSTPASASTLVTRLVVVVLPCVPAIAMPCFKRISSASITARGTTGTGNVRRRVPDRDADAERREALRRRAVALVRARHGVAEVVQDLGDAAH